MQQFTANLIAVLAVSVSLFAVYQLSRQTKASIVLGCLTTYLDIARTRDRAITEGSVRLAKNYYRELFDLLWSEFRLWRSGLIPRGIIEAWADSCYRRYQDADSVSVRDGDTGKTISVQYKEIWEKLEQIRYFCPEDSFIKFMSLVHDGKIDKALKVRGR